MKSIVFCVLLSLLPMVLAAQTNHEEHADWQQLMEQLMDLDDDESGEAWEQQYEQLADLYEQKIDLATATREELEQLPFLSAEQVEQICEYLYRYGPMQSLGELAMIESLDAQTRQLLVQFVKLGTAATARPASSLQKRGNQKASAYNDSVYNRKQAFFSSGETKGGLLLTARIPFYERRGDKNGYLGYPYRHTLRYTMNLNRHLRFGLVGAQDSGEPFFSNKNTLGYDHYSFYAQARRLGRLKTLVVGHYRLRLGLGGVICNNLYLGKLSMFDRVGRITTAITPHSSRMSANYLQGAAATIALSGDLDLTAFVSYRKIDATLAGDSAIRTRLATGYHRTPSEMERKNNASEWLMGGRLSWQHGHWQAGLTALANGYDLPLQGASEVGQGTSSYRAIYPEGKTFGNVGMDYGYHGRRLSLSGETAIDKEGALATINTLSFRPVATLRLMAVQRFYSYHYHALHASSFGESGNVQNESGVLLGATWQAAPHLQLLAYTDYAYFPWARYQVSQSSHATDHLLQLRWRHRQLTLLARYRLRLQQRDDSSVETDGIPPLVTRSQHRLRLAVGYDLGRLTTRTQLDAAFSHTPHQATTATNSRGWMLGQTADYRWRRLMLSAHVAYFHTDDYDSRLYAYERNLRYAFSFPAYFDHGLRGALYASYSLGRHFTAAAKLSTTHYFDRSTIGTGLQQIDGSTQTDLELQLGWRL